MDCRNGCPGQLASAAAGYCCANQHDCYRRTCDTPHNTPGLFGNLLGREFLAANVIDSIREMAVGAVRFAQNCTVTANPDYPTQSLDAG
jgi:hypothetical protein